MKIASTVLVLPLLSVALAPASEPASALRPWNDYQVILWIGDSASKQPDKFPQLLDRMREMGVTAGMVTGDADPGPWVKNGFPYYVENIVNRGLCLKWNSKVRDWDAFVTQWRKTGDTNALVRDYSLDDPQWLGWAKDRMRAAARVHAAHAPLAYDIRDELSVTMSANPFDYDFSPATLGAFRAWLITRYADLAALNRQWDTSFASWDAVRPFTTDEIKNRMAGGGAMPRGQPDWPALAKVSFEPDAARRDPVRWNFSPWCDFRTYLDVSLARTLDACRAAVREIDPRTPVGIEGTQMPHAFGGYDLWRLSQVLDWVEPYDIGNARPIFGSFMPGRPILCTVGEKDANPARRRLWHLLLEGDRGCIVWWSEDCIDFAKPDWPLTAKGQALAPVFRELTGPLAALFLRATREFDPVAIHYSQPSIQVGWLLESTVDGRTWHRRFSSYEAKHNRLAAQRNRYWRDLRAAGFSPRFVSSEQIENGELERGGWKALVLPGPLALSDREAGALKTFAAAGGTLFYEGPCGSFDERGKLRAGDAFEPRPSGRSPSAVALTAVAPPIRVTPPDAQTAVYRYRLGRARLLAVERNVSWHMTENLKQEGDNSALEKPVDIEVRLPAPAHVYDLRSSKSLGRTDRLAVTLDPWQPSLFALLDEPVPVDGLMAFLVREGKTP